MNSCNVAKTMQFLTAVLGLGLLSLHGAGASAGAADDGSHVDNQADGDHQLDRTIRRVRGIAVTGTNHVLGKPIFHWIDEEFGTFNFPTLFAYNEHGPEPLPLDEFTPDSTVLASGVSPLYLLPRGREIKPEWVNVPLRQVPVLTDFRNIDTQPLRGLMEAEPMEVSQSEPADPITLGQWMKAGGDVKIECSGQRADVKLRMSNLIPNRIYSVWALMRLPLEFPPPGTTLKSTSVALPLGGTPNVFVTDANGDATFERHVKFCPLNSPTSDLPSMLTLEIQYHANHQTYGAIPLPGFVDGNWHGVIQFTHVVFPINVRMLNDQDPPETVQ